MPGTIDSGVVSPGAGVGCPGRNQPGGVPLCSGPPDTGGSGSGPPDLGASCDASASRPARSGTGRPAAAPFCVRADSPDAESAGAGSADAESAGAGSVGHPSSSACSGGTRGRGTSPGDTSGGVDSSGSGDTSGGDTSAGGDAASGGSAWRGTTGTGSGGCAVPAGCADAAVSADGAVSAGCGSSGPVSPRCGQPLGLRRPWAAPGWPAGGGAAPRPDSAAPFLDSLAPFLDPAAPRLGSLMGFQSAGGAAAAPRRRALYRRSRSRLASSSGSPRLVSAFRTASASAEASGPTLASMAARVRPTKSSRSPLGSTFVAASDTRPRYSRIIC